LPNVCSNQNDKPTDSGVQTLDATFSSVFGSHERLQIICDYLFLHRRFSLAAGKEIVSLQQLKIDPVWDSIR
jgi:hypothetical protein